MGGWINEWMGGWMNEWMNEWMGELMKRLMNGFGIESVGQLVIEQVTDWLTYWVN